MKIPLFIFILASLFSIGLQSCMENMNLEPSIFGIIPKCCIDQNYIPDFSPHCLKYVKYALNFIGDK